ncbi:hypothetical protein [Citrobacter freundii]|uniref:hypothetical protein n=1 Tax=Citrobacter freundii TaxID=546 RepID=UPI0019049B5B|nr:hypothetical protein [Citrobacter freundii]MBJ8931647.1 hypothetical protein [Citrobacter freundii]
MIFNIVDASKSGGKDIVGSVLIDNDLIDDKYDKSEIAAISKTIYEQNTLKFAHPIKVEPVRT